MSALHEMGHWLPLAPQTNGEQGGLPGVPDPEFTQVPLVQLPHAPQAEPQQYPPAQVLERHWLFAVQVCPSAPFAWQTVLLHQSLEMQSTSEPHRSGQLSLEPEHR